MTFLDIVRMAIGNAFRSRLRTTLTVIAIFIGAFTLTITTAIGTGVSSYINTQVASVGATDVLTVTKASPTTTSSNDGPAKYDPNAAKGGAGGLAAAAGGGASLSKDDIVKIGATKGITSTQAITQVSPDFIQYSSGGKYQLTVNAVAAFTKADLAAGSQLSSSSGDNQVILPIDYLQNLGLGSSNTAKEARGAIGKTVTIGITDYLGAQSTVSATVVGVQNTTLIGGGVGLNKHLSTALSTVQTTGKPASLGQSYRAVAAYFDPHDNRHTVDDIKKDLKNQGFTAQTVADQLGTFETVINGIIGVLDAFAIIALVAAGFGIINTLLMSVQERTREIGLMKAMGMSGGKVYALFSVEAVFIGFLGSAIGAIVAIGLGLLISRGLSRTVLSGLPGLHVLEFSPGSIATIILVVMFIAFLAGTLPARRAARQNPIDALRYE